MKVFGKWLVMVKTSEKKGIVASFDTKKESIEELTLLGFIRKADNEWLDSLGNKYHIEKNIKEYGRG